MNVYQQRTMGETIKDNSYVGRGILVGMTKDEKKAVVAYFIMGRSENSRNRIFREKGEEVIIYPFDESKVEDPSLIIYSPIRRFGGKLIVTNGDQTDTIYDSLSEGGSFESGLMTREFEPDEPNWTPRISSILHLDGKNFHYDMSILKSLDEDGKHCGRFFYKYDGIGGLGHFIHTYERNGSPLPTFQGEPRRISIPDDIDTLAKDIWNHLDSENKISLYVRFVDLVTGEMENRMYNLNERKEGESL